MTARLVSQYTAIYQISKNAFFDIVTKDNKLVKHIIKLLVEDVKNLDPPIKYLDFIQPDRKTKWPGKISETLRTKEDFQKADSLSKQLK